MDSSNFSEMIMNVEHESGNTLEDEFYNYYLEGDSWDENEEDEHFESSQLHQLVHTQPIHLINQQVLYGDAVDDMGVPSSSRSSMSSTFEEMGGSNDSENNTAITSATSAHFKHNLYDMGVSEWDLFKQQSQYYDMGDAEDSNREVPRCMPLENRDANHFLDFSQCIPPNTDIEIPADHNYNYPINTDASYTGRRPTEEEIFFVKSLNSKLSRYTGYFGAGSRDQEYHDKVRFQEISYKFSKTYF